MTFFHPTTALWYGMCCKVRDHTTQRRRKKDNMAREKTEKEREKEGEAERALSWMFQMQLLRSNYIGSCGVPYGAVGLSYLFSKTFSCGSQRGTQQKE